MLGAYYPGQGYPGESGLPSTTVLIIQSANVSVSADNLLLTQRHTLVISDAGVIVTADVVNPVPNLAIQDASISVTADNIALIQHFTLAINDTSVAVSADSVDVVKFTPEIRPHEGVADIGDPTVGIDLLKAIISVGHFEDASGLNFVEDKSSVDLTKDNALLAAVHRAPTIVEINKDSLGVGQLQENPALEGLTMNKDGDRPFPVEDDLMEDTVALMESTTTYMGGSVSFGSPDRPAGMTVEKPQLSTHNTLEQKGLANGLSN